METSYTNWGVILNSSYEIKKASVGNEEAIATIQSKTWVTTYAGLIPEECMNLFSYENRLKSWKNILSNPEPVHQTYLATDNGIPAGFLTFGETRDPDLGFSHELWAIYVLQEFQGKGIGRSLLSTALENSKEKISGMHVWVLAQNPHRIFYEMLGGKSHGTKDIEVASFPLEHLGFGWKNIQNLKILLKEL